MLPGLTELSAKRKAQAKANWDCFQPRLPMPHHSPGDMPDEPMQSASQQETMLTSVSMGDEDGDEEMNVPEVVEDWMDDAREGAQEQGQHGVGLPTMELKGMKFWESVSWNSMQQRWSSMKFVPSDIRLALMQLRSAVASAAGQGDKECP